MTPTISVIVTTHNLAWCIADTLRSVLAQTYTPLEIIVVDDGSTDDTERIVRSFSARVRFLPLPPTRNPAVVRNRGIAIASGEYIAPLDGDDFWQPEKLAVQVAVARQHPSAGLIAVDGVQFQHADGKILKDSLFADDIQWGEERAIVQVKPYERLLTGNYIDTTSQILVPRRILKAVGGYTTHFPPPDASDWDLLLKIAARQHFVLIRQKLVHYRYRPSSVSGPSALQDIHFAPADIAVLRRHLGCADLRYRQAIATSIERRFHHTCARAVQAGSRKRVWASKTLWSLLRQTPTLAHAKVVATRLAQLWLPICFWAM